MKVLIVTDNIPQYVGVKSILDKYSISVDYRHSHFKSGIWEHPDFQSKNHSINIKLEYPQLINKYDLIISVHCKQLFPAELVKKVRCINIHPGYNPINRGWFPQVFAIVHNLPIGVTIHEMDEELDHGRIIARTLVEMRITDTSKDIYERLLKAELDLFNENAQKILAGTYDLVDPEEQGNLFWKRDFEQLRKFDPDEEMTFMQFYNRVRALTHGDLKNGFFVNPESGKKIYFNINIFEEP